MRRARQSLMFLGVLVLSGCFHAVIETGRPAGSTVVSKPWAMSFIYGLVPPPVENVSQQCRNGVSKVETKHSFLNGLVQWITFGLVTPMEITVTCAGGGGDDDNALAVRAEGDPRAALTQAIELSRTTGQAVYAIF